MVLITLVSTFASLLSGSLQGNGCANVTATDCFGGVAAVSAMIRANTIIKQQQQEQGVVVKELIIPRVDTQSAFVQQHPDGWSVNQVIFQDMMGWRAFSAPPSLVKNDAITRNDANTAAGSINIGTLATTTTLDYGAVEGLQSLTFPLLMTNVAIPPSNSWFPFVDTIFFDDETKLAVMSVVPNNGGTGDITTKQVDAALGCLHYIARLNAELEAEAAAAATTTTTPANVFDGLFGGTGASSSSTTPEFVWIPVIYFAQPNSERRFEQFRTRVMNEGAIPPALIVDVEGNAQDDYGTAPQLVNNGTTWIVSYSSSSSWLHRLDLETSTTVPGRLANVELNVTKLWPLEEEFKDDTYANHLLELRSLADEAVLNDPVVGQSGFVPLTRPTNGGNERVCMGGECVIGNLFTDAMRWYTQTDISFITSGGVRGEGWEAGNVHVSDLWNALPFPNHVCQGVMTGISVFRLLNFSTSLAEFQSTYTPEGDRLLQISGARYVYNTEWNTSRLVAVEVWDETEQTYLPLERLKLYSFSTDNFLCAIDRPYPTLLTDALTLEGEVPGVIDDESLVHQFIVAEYLTNLNATYNTTLEGRLSNDTSALVPLNLIQTQDECGPATSWQEDLQTCVECPEASTNVAFSDDELNYIMSSGGNSVETEETGRVLLVNRELFDVSVRPKSVPSFFSFINFNETAATTIQSGDSLALDFGISSNQLPPGVASGTVSVSVLDQASLSGCLGRDVTFDVVVTVTPNQDLNQLGSLAFVGMGLAAVVLSTSILFASTVLYHRNERVLKTLQPPFLLTICVGIMVLGSSIFPYSIDDGMASSRLCDITCMGTPWLLSIGFTISFAALFSKLWRINKLFNQKTIRRIQVKERDVIIPFVVLFALNCIALSIWTVLDPWTFERVEITGQPWNTQGVCSSEGPIASVMIAILVTINAAALVLACYQAYLARNISDDFSESKYLGMALFSWVQVLIVGGPIIFLLNNEPDVRYFLVVAIIFTSCMSMLLLIFVPIMINLRRSRQSRASGARKHQTARIGREYGSVVVSGDAAVTNMINRTSDQENNNNNNYMGSTSLHMTRRSSTQNSEIEAIELKNQVAHLNASINQLRQRNWHLEDRNGELEQLMASQDWNSSRSKKRSFVGGSGSVDLSNSQSFELSEQLEPDDGDLPPPEHYPRSSLSSNDDIEESTATTTFPTIPPVPTEPVSMSSQEEAQHGPVLMVNTPLDISNAPGVVIANPVLLQPPLREEDELDTSEAPPLPPPPPPSTPTMMMRPTPKMSGSKRRGSAGLASNPNGNSRHQCGVSATGEEGTASETSSEKDTDEFV